MKPIQVFVRHCAHSPNSDLPSRQRPEWFSKEACWNNLRATINPDLADITVIYDTHFGELPRKYAPDRVVTINRGTEAESFLGMLGIIELKNLKPDTIVYLLEDDYLHLPGWCEALLEAFTLPVHYVTLYDHADKYEYYPDLKSKVFVTKKSHWRTTPSTTNTYACKMSQLAEDWNIHTEYSENHNNGVTSDTGKFDRLAQLGRILLSPMPGFSTHCDQLLSPIVNWKQINKQNL